MSKMHGPPQQHYEAQQRGSRAHGHSHSSMRLQLSYIMEWLPKPASALSSRSATP